MSTVELTKFVPSYKHLSHLFPSPGDDLHAHRVQVQAFCYERDGPCWVEGCDRTGIWHLHEGVYRRSDVQGWKRGRRVTIHTPYNCITLCDGIHHETALEPSDVEVADWMLATYGTDFVRWCRDYLEFKVNPLRGWLEQFSH